MTTLRRRLAGIFARLAVRIDPDPALSFTTTTPRRIYADYATADHFDPVRVQQYKNVAQAVADVANSQLGGLGIKRPPDARP